MLYGNFIILALGYSILPAYGAIIPMRDRKGRLSLVEWDNYNYREPEGYGTYAFGYEIEDPENNNVQFRNEEKLFNGSVVGSYGYLEPDGDVFLVTYIADKRGYRANIERPLKLSFLRPIEKEGSKNLIEEPKTVANNRIVTPDENLSNKNKPHQHSTPHEESNAFYYPQNILESADFNRNMNQSKTDKITSQGSSADFNSVEESNAFYYPQNILESEDFHKSENFSDQIIFQRKSENASQVEGEGTNSKKISKNNISGNLSSGLLTLKNISDDSDNAGNVKNNDAHTITTNQINAHSKNTPDYVDQKFVGNFKRFYLFGKHST